MANISVADKSSGDKLFATDVDSIVNWINAPSSALGTFSGAVEMTSSGNYTDLTTTGNLTITHSGTPVEGAWRKVTITFNGTHTLTVPAGSQILNSSFTDGAAPASGTYDLWIVYVGAKYKYNLTDITTVS